MAGETEMTRDLLFLDTETTGLDPARHVVCDIWVERRRWRDLELIAASGGHVLVPPEDLACASAEALRVNGYTDEAWTDAVPWPVAWGGVLEVIGPPAADVVAVVGSNPKFDLEMIAAMHWRYGTSPARIRRVVFDTVSMASPLKAAGLVRGCGLSALAEYYGLPPQDHSARGDVGTCVEVYRKLIGLEGAR